MNPNLPPNKKFQVRLMGIPVKIYFYGYEMNMFWRELRLTLGELNINHTI